MYTDMVTKPNGQPIPESFVDTMVIALASLHDPKNHKNVYIVKPKLHGPDEVKTTVKLFEKIEKYLCPNLSLKLGIMDEERRTTVNLKECIRAAKDRVVFINTGFLDRTGDEIHTNMRAGPVKPKADIKNEIWLKTYEDWNVDVGLKLRMPGHAQIGKGMWAMPDKMNDMIQQKIGHPKAGANTAWVPSPTAAALHSTHYHYVDVFKVQKDLSSRKFANLLHILTPPLLGEAKLSAETIQRELDNNAQGILGYVSRWVDQGVGCSKIPDINNVGLMEDRATLRISSQHISNWLLHKLVSKEQVVKTFHKMAEVVDKQNTNQPEHKPLRTNPDTNLAMRASLELALNGTIAPNGYTEGTLHSFRRLAKRK
eukprot:NODE_3875_length_1270_cov_70.560593_g3397_i0.p1 GENE.NODE_3875_length_1270_cov_70.560593_g3397_i0~~NODE_3875_length_1270_cov_70.560593_g3397_i0.p1  ORF type:complete len:400 (-),score=77.18 NODE_3875_length_1270_cov_70.560593_g3397_i0:69-1175(-)